MKNNTLTLILFSLTLVFYACSKKKVQVEDGIYNGNFTVTYSSESYSGYTTLELKNGKFWCTGNPNRIPAGGSGTFSSTKKQLIFQDENFWTADFDWGLILSGTYDYSFDGKNLKFSVCKKSIAHYSYDLQKQ